MAQKIIVLVCLQAIIFHASAQVLNSQVLNNQVLNSQVLNNQVLNNQVLNNQLINRLAAPPCGCTNNLQQISLEQLLLPAAGPVLQNGALNYLPGPQTVVYDQPPTTIIQDSTVANNLANALQLLVVSNLLSSALPLDAPAPSPLPLYAPLDLPAPLVAQRAPCNCGCNAGFNPYNNVVLY